MELLKVISSLYNDINPATLSGAVDVVVVEQEDGSMQSSPFHVRFGKLTLLRAQERQVSKPCRSSLPLPTLCTMPLTYTHHVDPPGSHDCQWPSCGRPNARWESW